MKIYNNGHCLENSGSANSVSDCGRGCSPNILVCPGCPGPIGPTGPAGASVVAMQLTLTGDVVSGGTATLSNGQTVNITVTTT